MSEGARLDRAGARAVSEAVRLHKRMGNAVAAWVDGKVVWVAPEDIPERAMKNHRSRRKRV